ncbi:hypothetical protein ACTFIU_006126 [Dictyostelium citrinum]
MVKKNNREEDYNILCFTIVSGKILEAYDSNGLADGYCKVGYLDESKTPNKTKWLLKTTVCNKTLEPHWSYSEAYWVPKFVKQIQLELFDHDIIGSDDFIGSVNVDISNLIEGTPEVEEYTLVKKDGKTKAASVLFMIQKCPTTDEFKIHCKNATKLELISNEIKKETNKLN